MEVLRAQQAQGEKCERCLFKEDAHGNDCKHRYVMGEQRMDWCMYYKPGTYDGAQFPKSEKKLREDELRREGIYFEEGENND